MNFLNRTWETERNFYFSTSMHNWINTIQDGLFLQFVRFWTTLRVEIDTRNFFGNLVTFQATKKVLSQI